MPKIPNPLSGVKIPNIPNPLSGVSSSGITNYLDSFLDEEEPQPIEEVVPSEENISPLTNSSFSSPTPLSQPVITQTLQDKLDEIQDEQPIEETKEETMLQETKDEEPIIEKSGEAQANEAINIIQGILKPVETTPTILETPKQEPTITQTLQEDEEEPLVKKKRTKKVEKQTAQQAEEPTLELKNPDVEGEVETGEQLVKTKKSKKSLIQVETKWQELKDQGLISTIRTREKPSKGVSGTRKGKEELLSEIRQIDPLWENE